MPKIVIANTLADGFVAFMREDGTWSPDIGHGAQAATEADAERLLERALQAAAANIVIDPYLIEVAPASADADSDRPRPLEYREYIRAFGPSVAIPT
ncbi:MAG: DUF2849 domain-containing protein [Gammaproteobacteria bacterium]|jgi:hypothetical protein|nr:DUF2849 domain-containing protein [Gammaproteobacteria bacterium]